MSAPRNIPELARPEGAEADAEELARSVEDAAEMVQAFVEQGAPGALSALLDAAGDRPGAAAKRATGLAEAVLRQAATLQGEVDRFLCLVPRE